MEIDYKKRKSYYEGLAKAVILDAIESKYLKILSNSKAVSNLAVKLEKNGYRYKSGSNVQKFIKNYKWR